MRSRFVCVASLIALLVSQAIAADSLRVRKLGEYRFSGSTSANDVAIYYWYVYVAATSNHLRVMNVSNPSSPYQCGTCYFGGAMKEVVVQEHNAYTVTNGLTVFGLGAPCSPLIRDVQSTPGVAEGVAVSGYRAYVAAREYGLRVVAIHNPDSLYEVGYYDTPEIVYANGVAAAGNYAYMVDYSVEGLFVIDVNDIPTLAGYLSMPIPSDVTVAGSFAYVVSWTNLRVIDVSDPTVPTEVGFLNTPSGTEDVFVSGDYAYVANNGGGLRVIDVSDRTDPFEVGYYRRDIGSDGYARGVAVAGHIAYVAESDFFGVYDVSEAIGWIPLPPLSPDSLVIEYLPETTDLRINWAPVWLDTGGYPTLVDRYVVYRSADLNPAHWDSIGEPVPPDTTFFIDSTWTDDMHYYRVRAVND